MHKMSHRMHIILSMIPLIAHYLLNFHIAKMPKKYTVMLTYITFPCCFVICQAMNSRAISISFPGWESPNLTALDQLHNLPWRNQQNIRIYWSLVSLQSLLQTMQSWSHLSMNNCDGDKTFGWSKLTDIITQFLVIPFFVARK